MKESNNFTTSIHIALKDLIEAKSKRDKVKFTSYQLANILCMPRSIITKLTHPDQSKRINNPKVATLIKIVEFFRKDGFNITIDGLLGISRNQQVDVRIQPSLINNIATDIPLYAFTNTRKKIGSITINLPQKINHIIALYSEDDIKPFFKAGSIFIVHLNSQPTNDVLIAIKFDTSEKIYIKKYFKLNNKIILKSLDSHEENIILMPTQSYNILGVIIQVNAKT